MCHQRPSYVSSEAIRGFVRGNQRFRQRQSEVSSENLGGEHLLLQRVAQRRSATHLSLLLGCPALGERLAQLLGALLGRLPQAPLFERTHLMREALKRSSEVIRGH